MRDTFANIFKLIRVKHWIKNTFVFLPAFFAARADLIISWELILVFFSFCFAASSIYVINDIVDVEKDRLHPKKCKRPIASGFFSKQQGFWILGLMITLFLLSLIGLKHAYIYVMSYFVMNLAYSFKLKQISIIDVSCISIGFVLRILAGGSEIAIPISHWMIIIVFLLTISMAFAKRRDDLILKIDKQNLRKALGGYNVQFLDVAKGITLSITLVSYIMYSISPEVIERVGSDNVYLTSLFVFLGLMRYLQITIVDNNSGSPTDILWRDRFIQITIVLWIATFAVLIYG